MQLKVESYIYLSVTKVFLDLPADVDYFPGSGEHEKETPGSDQVLTKERCKPYY